jgi:hypothetical protein
MSKFSGYFSELLFHSVFVTGQLANDLADDNIQH